jgi:hypothetical protein
MPATFSSLPFSVSPPQSRGERIARIDALASLLDSAFLIPGTNIRFGFDALIGLVPGIGDALTTLISLYIVREARALGAPRLLIARMIANVAIDGMVGAIPLLVMPLTSPGARTGATSTFFKNIWRENPDGCDG